MQRESGNFDDQGGISSEHEKIVTENRCSRATPVDVSALDKGKRELDPIGGKNYVTDNTYD